MRLGRSAVVTAAALGVAVASYAVAVPGAEAASTLPALPSGYVAAAVPADGVFDVVGRAWGHRIGMSQVGAQYAGRTGVPVADILAHYYPGTTLTRLSATKLAKAWPGTPAGADRPVVRVLLDDNTGRRLTVTAASALRLRSPSGALTTLPGVAGSAARWRLTAVDPDRPASGLTLRYQVGATSSSWRTAGPTLPLGSGFAATGDTGVRVELSSGRTRTEPAAVVLTRKTWTSTSWATVSWLDPETYLAPVVAAEIGSGSAPAAQQAQAVAARSYAARLADLYGAGRNYDLCAVTSCQYYPGIATGTVSAGRGKDTSRVYAATTKAVTATRDQVLLYGSSPAFTQFAASNGGYSKSGGQPYLPAQADPWDAASGSSSSSWTARLPVSALAHLVPNGDRITSVAVGGRDGHGDLGGAPSAVLIDSVSPTGALHRTATTPVAVGTSYQWPGHEQGTALVVVRPRHRGAAGGRLALAADRLAPARAAQEAAAAPGSYRQGRARRAARDRRLAHRLLRPDHRPSGHPLAARSPHPGDRTGQRPHVASIVRLTPVSSGRRPAARTSAGARSRRSPSPTSTSSPGSGSDSMRACASAR